jgi:drug/metabolite transporter (DMT)-like permease
MARIKTTGWTLAASEKASEFRQFRLWPVACLIVGIGVFSLQDLIIKLISGAYPLHQAMTIRSLVAMPVLIAMVEAEGGVKRLFSPRSPLMALRGFINLVSYTAYYLGLAALPIATCVALFFTAPLFITVLSVLTLKETVEPRRWLAVLLGFVGVIIIVRPATDVFEWAALLPVFAGVTYAASQIVARKVGQAEGSATMATYSNVVFLAGASAMAALFGGGDFANEDEASLAFLVRGWTTPGPTDLILMMSCGVIAAISLTLLSEAYRSAPANQIAPFEYSALCWGVIYGWLVWRELPDAVGWLGTAIIIGAGLYLLYSDRGQSTPRA